MSITSETTYTREQIQRLGVRFWPHGKGGPHWELRDWEELIGLRMNYYKAGNVSSATVDGGPLAITSASLLRARAWFDGDGRLVTDLDEYQRHVTGLALVARLYAAVAQAVAEQETEDQT